VTFEMMNLVINKVWRVKFCARDLQLSHFCWEQLFFRSRLRDLRWREICQYNLTTEERNRQNTIAKNYNKELTFPGFALEPVVSGSVTLTQRKLWNCDDSIDKRSCSLCFFDLCKFY
jgi:hypothetical protein